ncbi:D-2-hydroxyacid dehydrogenase [Hahella sp. CR1]|uniref:D-2-hydroxyacid dehydrogenase n=1 Tax=Hahella sp. CR1 TaxID=2992807 RepID=UPI002442F9FE|nr:D-2-hydroxyacid dehydrogenase [Hahella sp. CR1]MDG9669791.1 D-2-hydroxyacid dehydrogenase [Hahella sp. CR1]
MKAVILDAESLGADVSLDSLKEHVTTFDSYAATTSEQVAERIAGKDIVIVNKVVLNEAHMVGSPELKLIAVTATGVNNIDMAAAKKHGVEVRNVAHYGTATIVQHVFSMVLALSNNLLRYTAAVERGDWGRARQFCLMDYPIRELSGKVFGVVGYGDLGRAAGAVAQAFGMEVKVGARPGTEPGVRDGVNYLPLEELLAQADVLSLHCLLSEDTRNMIGAVELALMKSDALLINTARGGLVDEAALADALRNGRLGGAGFDVLTEEPPVNGNLLLAQDIPNLIITPHCAWSSREARQRLVDKTGDNIAAFAHREERQVRL